MSLLGGVVANWDTCRLYILSNCRDSTGCQQANALIELHSDPRGNQGTGMQRANFGDNLVERIDACYLRMNLARISIPGGILLLRIVIYDLRLHRLLLMEYRDAIAPTVQVTPG